MNVYFGDGGSKDSYLALVMLLKTIRRQLLFTVKEMEVQALSDFERYY
jgi:hypothetical protein